jgi:hypothetical protein
MPRWWILAYIVNNYDLPLIIVNKHLGVIVITLLRHFLPIFWGDGDWLEAFLLLIQAVGTCLSFQYPSLLGMEFNMLYDSYIRQFLLCLVDLLLEGVGVVFLSVISAPNTLYYS